MVSTEVKEGYGSFDPGIEAEDDVTFNATKDLEQGKVFYSDTLDENNIIKAFDCFYRSAKNGNMEAQLRLADLYALGQGTEESHTDAYKWYTKAAIQGFQKALSKIHHLYEHDKKMHCHNKLNSEEEQRKKPKSFSTQGKSSEKNHCDGLNKQRLEDRKVTLNCLINYYADQFEKFTSSDQDDVDVQLNLAFLYQHGYGAKMDTMRALELYTKAAKQGHRDAQYNVAYLYQNSRDYRQALRWYRISAINGNIVAQNCLAHFYETGLATDVNNEGAVYWYTVAAKNGNSNAQLTLEVLCRKWQNAEKNVLEIGKWHKLSALQGINRTQDYTDKNVIDSLEMKSRLDPVDQVKLGKAYFNSVYSESNCLNAFKWFSRAAEVGNMEAQFRLADLYALGQGTKQSHTDAYKWYTKAALQGYKKALIRIHNLYEQDRKMHCRGKLNSEEELRKRPKNVPTQSETSEEKYYRELYEQRLEDQRFILNNSIDYFTDQFKKYTSTNQEDTDVQLNLAFLYQHGYGTKKYTMRALELYTIAAEKGHRDAQYNAAYLYHITTNIKFNYRHALRWYRASATNGNIAAQNHLAYFYEKGLATEVNWEGALYWYTKAANSGHSNAQITLGKLYRKGQGVDQDFLEAAKWYKLSAAQGNNAAKNCLEQLYRSGKLNYVSDTDSMLKNDLKIPRMLTLCSKLQKDISILNDLSHVEQLKTLAMHALMTDGNAMYRIGINYYNGVELPLEKDTGYLWIRRAAMTGLPEAVLKIAKMHKEGDTVHQDYHTSGVWTMKGVRQKNSKAQCNLGLLYKEGLGVRKDPLEASKWFIKAGDQNNSDAQYQFGLLKYEGKGVRKDKDEAAKWFDKSVLQGNPLAFYNLGKIYEAGGFIKNAEYTTIKLYKNAAYLGNEDAQFKLGRIYEEGKLVKQDLVRAHKYYVMAVNSGNSDYQYQLAIKYINETFDDPDYSKAFDLFKKAEEKNHEKAILIFQTPIRYSPDINNYFNVVKMLIRASEGGVEGLKYIIGYAYEYGITHGDKISLNNGKYISTNEKLFCIDFKKAIHWYSYAAVKGDSKAQYRLGCIYEEGKGVPKDFDKAFHYYNQACSDRNTDAMYSLGLMYLNGNGVSQDLVKAFYLFTEASNMGHEEARITLVPSKYSKSLEMLESVADLGIVALQYQLGEFYENEDSLKSFKWFTLAAKGGTIDAYYRLGKLCEEGKGTLCDYSKAIVFYEKAIEKDHEEALYRLAELYLLGEKIECNYLKAYNLYSRAAKLGHAEAFRILNEIWDTKLNINETNQENPFNISSKRLIKVIRMFSIVAEDGNTDLQYQLGLFYERNEYNQNHLEACKWYRMAANNNHLEAIYHLGLLYEKGLGVIQDHNKAIQLYYQAKDQGSRDSLYRLGVIFYHGHGVKINHSKAINFYKEAAALGNGQSQYALGRLYELGYFLQNNILKALEWYTKAYLNDTTSVIPKLYNLYDHEPYERFFHDKLFQILSKLEISYKSDNSYDYAYYGSIYFKLGKMYLYGIGTNKNNAKALMQFLKAYYNYSYEDAEPFITLEYEKSQYSHKRTFIEILNAYKEIQKSIPSEHLYEIGMLYYDGYSTYKANSNTLKSTKTKIIVPKDNSIAKQYLELVSKEKLAEAQHQLGIINLESNDIRQAIVWFSKEAETLGRNACYHKGMQYRLEKRYGISFFYLKKAAESNHAQALEQLIMMYLQGDGVEKNVDKAMVLIEKSFQVMSPDQCFEQGMKFYKGDGVDINDDISLIYLRKAAGKNEGLALAQLGIMYLQGYGVEKNVDEAMMLIEKSLQLMSPDECYHQGMKFYDGFEVDINYDIALMYLRKAADKNNGQALSQLGIMYLEGCGVEKNVGEAIKLIEELTQIISPNECYEQGMEFYKGIGVEKNGTISLVYFKKAASKKHVPALEQLSKMFLQGDGVEKNLDEALQWITKHAKEIPPKECYELGMEYLEGVRADKNYKIARIYLEKAAENGHPEGQYQLGMLYFEGNGVEKNIDEAAKWMERSINKMDPEKCYKLGNLLYEHGKDIEKNQKDASMYYQRALMWFEKAAEKENRESQLKTGIMYMQGLGIESNFTEAIKWLELYSKEMTSYQYYERGMNFFVGDKYGKSYETSVFFLKKASELRNSSAQAQLGDMYLRGLGTKQDYEEAIKMYELSTNEMSDYYCYERALKFYIGNGVTQNYEISFLYMKKAAEKGHNEAKSKVGEMYIQGRGVKSDKNKAINWFKLYAERMDGYACYERGTTYYDGDGVEKNHEIALIYLTFAAEKEYSESYGKLGDMYLQGSGTDKNFGKAISYFELYTKGMSSDKLYDFAERYYRASDDISNRKISLIYFEKAAKEDQGLAQARLAEMYLLGLEVKQNVDKAMELFEASTRNMDKYDMFDLGERFFYGDEVEKNYKVAAIYFKTAAEEDNDQAQAKLGDMYYYGYGVEQNYTKAIEWHERSLEGIDPSDCYDLGSKYYSDLDDPNYHIAFVYYKQAAEGGYDIAQNALGDMYLNGYGVEKNITEALKWIKNAAKSSPSTYSYKLGEMYHASQGIQDFSKALEAYKKVKGSKKSYALRGIGVLYEYGDDVDQDYQKAFDYYKQAAEARNKGAYYNLGLMYYNGRGTSQNYEEAFKWFTETTKGSPKNDDTYIFVQSRNKHANDTSTFEKREYSLQKEGFIYGKAHYYLGTMYKEGQGTQKNENEAKKHFEISI